MKKEPHPERVYFALIDVKENGFRVGKMVILPPDGERQRDDSAYQALMNGETHL